MISLRRLTPTATDSIAPSGQPTPFELNYISCPESEVLGAKEATDADDSYVSYASSASASLRCLTHSCYRLDLLLARVAIPSRVGVVIVVAGIPEVHIVEGHAYHVG